MQNTFDTNSTILAKYLTESVGQNSIPLLETSLYRVFTKHTAEGYFIISASRNEYTQEENRKRTKQLEDDIRSYGYYSYLPVTGGFVETKKDEATGSTRKVEVTELAFLVMSKKKLSSPEAKAQFIITMLDDAKALCAKWNQESILIQIPGQPPMYLTAAGKVDGVFDGDPTFNNMVKTYFTKLHRGKDTDPSHMGSHGRWSFRTKEEQEEDESKLGLATNGPSGTINGNHSRFIHGDLSEELFREG